MWTDENRARYDRSALRYPSDVTDEEWALIAPVIPRAERGGKNRTARGRSRAAKGCRPRAKRLSSARPYASRLGNSHPGSSSIGPGSRPTYLAQNRLKLWCELRSDPYLGDRGARGVQNQAAFS
jgi:hypothetical protein